MRRLPSHRQILQTLHPLEATVRAGDLQHGKLIRRRFLTARRFTPLAADEQTLRHHEMKLDAMSNRQLAINGAVHRLMARGRDDKQADLFHR